MCGMLQSNIDVAGWWDNTAGKGSDVDSNAPQSDGNAKGDSSKNNDFTKPFSSQLECASLNAIVKEIATLKSAPKLKNEKTVKVITK